MIGKGVMKTAADVEADAVHQSAARRQNRASGRQPESFRHLTRVRKLQLHKLVISERAGLEAVYPAGLMDAEDILVAGWLGLKKIGFFGEALQEEAVVNQPELLRGKNVRADIQVVAGMPDEFEGKLRHMSRTAARCKVIISTSRRWLELGWCGLATGGQTKSRSPGLQMYWVECRR